VRKQSRLADSLRTPTDLFHRPTFAPNHLPPFSFYDASKSACKIFLKYIFYYIFIQLRLSQCFNPTLRNLVCQPLLFHRSDWLKSRHVTCHRLSVDHAQRVTVENVNRLIVWLTRIFRREISSQTQKATARCRNVSRWLFNVH